MTALACSVLAAINPVISSADSAIESFILISSTFDVVVGRRTIKRPRGKLLARGTGADRRWSALLRGSSASPGAILFEFYSFDGGFKSRCPARRREKRRHGDG